MNSATVLVTGVGGASVGNQALKALRMAEREYRLVVADASADSLRLSQIAPAYLLPRAGEADYFDALARLCQKERVQVLVPGTEQELRVVVRHRDRLQEMGALALINDSCVIDLCMDKMATAKFLACHGFAAPRSVLVECEDHIAVPAPFPLVVKPVRNSGGSRNVFIAQQEDELRFFVRFLMRNAGGVLVQEYVGTPDQEYTVGVLSGLDGELIGSIALRRYISDALSTRMTLPNSTGRAELGPRLVISSGFSHGEVDEFPLVRQKCEELAAALGSRGPLNIQCRVCDGEIVPFEINPRISGSASIRALLGFNEPDLLIRRELLGEREVRPRYKKGVVLRSLVETCVAAADPNGTAATDSKPAYEASKLR